MAWDTLQLYIPDYTCSNGFKISKSGTYFPNSKSPKRENVKLPLNSNQRTKDCYLKLKTHSAIWKVIKYCTDKILMKGHWHCLFPKEVQHVTHIRRCISFIDT